MKYLKIILILFLSFTSIYSTTPDIKIPIKETTINGFLNSIKTPFAEKLRQAIHNFEPALCTRGVGINYISTNFKSTDQIDFYFKAHTKGRIDWGWFGTTNYTIWLRTKAEIDFDLSFDPNSGKFNTTLNDINLESLDVWTSLDAVYVIIGYVFGPLVFILEDIIKDILCDDILEPALLDIITGFASPSQLNLPNGAMMAFDSFTYDGTKDAYNLGLNFVPPAPLTAGISGPTQLEQGESGTWNAIYTGGSGTVSYQWWKKIGSGSWVSIGGNTSSISTTMGTESFTLKVGVTRGGYYEEATHVVTFLPSIDVWITGPSVLEYKHTGTWEANYEGGTGIVSYQWWKQYDGSSTWTSVGTASSYTSNMGATGFTLKLRVTRGTDYAEDTHNVYSEMEPKFNGLMTTPTEYNLYQNFPNPFNPETKISFDLPEDSNVKINIYDTSGRMVSNLVTGFYNAGRHSVSFNAGSHSSGIYFYIIEAGSFKQIQKMTLIK